MAFEMVGVLVVLLQILIILVGLVAFGVLVEVVVPMIMAAAEVAVVDQPQFQYLIRLAQMIQRDNL